MPYQPERSFNVGGDVEICGLANGKEHNGKRATITKYIEETGRFSVKLESGLELALKPANLRDVVNSQSDGRGQKRPAVNCAMFTEGDLVEVVGLTSAKGKEHNSRTGIVVGHDDKAERYKVKLDAETTLSLKTSNLVAKHSRQRQDNDLRDRLVAKREAEVKARVDEASVGFKACAEDAKRMRADKIEAGQQIRDKVKSWAMQGDEVRDIKSLLSTLQDVLWAGSGWEQVSPVKLATAGEVRRAFVRAVRILRANDLEKADALRQALAESVFQYLSQANSAKA